MPELGPSTQENVIVRWHRSSASERANYQSFLSELCDFRDLPRPQPSQAEEDANTYAFDKAVVYKELDGSTTTNFIDLYKKGCFVLEAKQGSNPVQEEMFEIRAQEPERRISRGTAIRGTRGWDTAMLRARGQAERYAKALPASEDGLHFSSWSIEATPSSFSPTSRSPARPTSHSPVRVTSAFPSKN